MSNPTLDPVNQAIKHYGEQEHPKQIWIMNLSILAALTIVNGCSIIWRWNRRRFGSINISVPASRGSKVSIRRIPAAIFTGCRIFSFRWIIPGLNINIFEGILTGAYISALLIWDFEDTSNLRIPKLWADRTAHIAASQIPLVVALASKNSVIQWLTGISHEKLNVVHRIAARTVLLMVWIHVWGRWRVAPNMILDERYKRYGVSAGIIFMFTAFISLRPIRTRFYEFFYLSHMILNFSLMVLVTLHVTEPGFGYYIWPAWALWGFDRVSRYTRYILLNFVFKPKESGATVEAMNDDALRITVQRNVLWGWKAGQHAFIVFPTIGLLESHPFTIANMQEDGKEKELLFIVRPRGGFTMRLRDYVTPVGNCKLPVFVDGPYGHPVDLTPYSTCILIGGGSGISYTLPHLQQLLKQIAAGKACTRRVVFLWVIRDKCHFQWLSRDIASICASLPPSLSLSIDIYITGAMEGYDGSPLGQGKSSSDDVEKGSESEEKTGELEVAIESVTMHQGRPVFSTILEQEITLAQGPVSVDVSGPASLVSSVRAALSTTSFASPIAVLKGMPTVQLHVENFTM